MESGWPRVYPGPGLCRGIQRDLPFFGIKESNAHAFGHAWPLAHRKYRRIFTVCNAHKRHANVPANVGITVLKVECERHRVAVFAWSMEAIAADPAHFNRHLTVTRLYAAGFGNDRALEAHIASRQHHMRRVRVSGTGSRRTQRDVAGLQRNNIGAIIQRGFGAESCPIQCQRGAGVVEDLNPHISCATRRSPLNSKRIGFAGHGNARERNRSFGGNGGIAIIQLNVETYRRAGVAFRSQSGRTYLAQLNGLIYRPCINGAGRVNNFTFEMNGAAVNRNGICRSRAQREG
ncbi:hypothetical protein BBAD15_g3153 [Beauveria bassiana D1-5]|uniref:Uncharacterized protein n=1 Tax=Beauveria bassiana D1-5 TaxID=1245745 RepID=A0A0A2VYA6_BEABA|nr:hypothetical protein BBAD15_g3153 [Beauveria bassiana D1-5]